MSKINNFDFFKRPKELVMSVITLMVSATFCYLAIRKNIEGTNVSPQALKEVLMFVLGGYFGGKLALSGTNGGGPQTPSSG
jgi:hypothetical protein